MFDLFISHTNDQEEQQLATALRQALKARNLSVYPESMAIDLGHDLLDKLSNGLDMCEFGFLVLSRAFLSMLWSPRELDEVSHIDDHARHPRLFLLWHNVEPDEVARFSPSLAQRGGWATQQGIQQLAPVIEELVMRTKDGQHIYVTNNMTLKDNSNMMQTLSSKAGGDTMNMLGLSGITRGQMSNHDLPHVHQMMASLFTEREIIDICQALNVSYDDLSGGSKEGKIRELLLFLQRRGDTAALGQLLNQLRPYTPWPMNLS